jgi:hypothetical protein
MQCAHRATCSYRPCVPPELHHPAYSSPDGRLYSDDRNLKAMEPGGFKPVARLSLREDANDEPLAGGSTQSPPTHSLKA